MAANLPVLFQVTEAAKGGTAPQVAVAIRKYRKLRLMFACRHSLLLSWLKSTDVAACFSSAEFSWRPNQLQNALAKPGGRDQAFADGNTADPSR